MTRRSVAGSDASSESTAASSSAKNGSSRITPYFTTSARPAFNSRSGSVVRNSVSMNTPAGWWNAPTRFLPAEMFTPVLPPTLLSTSASSVVGT